MNNTTISTTQDLIYSLIFDLPKEGGIEVNKFVEGMKDCLVALEEISHTIIDSIDNTIQVVSYIEELKAGSIEYKLQDKINENKKLIMKNNKDKSVTSEQRAEKAIDLVFAAGTSVVMGDYSSAILFF